MRYNNTSQMSIADHLEQHMRHLGIKLEEPIHSAVLKFGLRCYRYGWKSRKKLEENQGNKVKEDN